MNNAPPDLYYTKTHEWVKKENDLLTVGITDHAQALLGDIVYVEMPDLEIFLPVGKESAVVESVKAAADIYCPVAGEVVEVNEEVIANPALINEDPYGRGWLFRLQAKEKDLAADKALLPAETYAQLVASETH